MLRYQFIIIPSSKLTEACTDSELSLGLIIYNNLHTLLLGDVNLPEIDYSRFTVEGGENSYPLKFFDVTLDLYLVPLLFLIYVNDIPEVINYLLMILKCGKL